MRSAPAPDELPAWKLEGACVLQADIVSLGFKV